MQGRYRFSLFNSIPILAHADDIDMIGWKQSVTIEAFTSLEKEAKGTNLFINQEKSKYMPVTKKSHEIYPHSLEAGPYEIQVVHSFTYLGSDANCSNDINAENPKLYTGRKYGVQRIEITFEVPLDLIKH